MNKTEFWLMNNPIRALVQRWIEIKEMKSLSNLEKGKTILEIGCGNGYGTLLIKKYFSPIKIIAIDLDEKMIALAKQNHSKKDIQFLKADATKLPFPNNSFDAVIDFGIIHHIPNWKQCLKELNRVLKKDGELIIEDGSIESFSSPFGRILKSFLDHPYNEMYTEKEFLEYLRELEFYSIKINRHNPLGLAPYFLLKATK